MTLLFEATELDLIPDVGGKMIWHNFRRFESWWQQNEPELDADLPRMDLIPDTNDAMVWLNFRRLAKWANDLYEAGLSDQRLNLLPDPNDKYVWHNFRRMLDFLNR